MDMPGEIRVTIGINLDIDTLTNLNVVNSTLVDIGSHSCRAEVRHRSDGKTRSDTLALERNYAQAGVYILSETAGKIKSVLSSVHGITDLAVFTSLGQPTVQIDIDRKRASRYGLSPGDINSTIKVAIGGDSAGELYEPGSDRHFPIVVRLAPQYRKSLEDIRNLKIAVQNPGAGTNANASAAVQTSGGGGAAR